MLFLEAAPPAGGAALDQVIGLTMAAVIVSLALGELGWAHRTHRIEWIAKLGERARSRTGEPGWSVIAVVVVAVALLVAILGFLWDVSLHAGRGRDDGPLANPAHYLILFGLFALFVSGMAAIVYTRDGVKPSLASVRITRQWYAPVSAVFIAGCGLYALIGFPLDDIWHRLFGQDVTLWGPTHLMLIGGAGLSTAGIVLMSREAKLSPDFDGSERVNALHAVIVALAFGAMLAGLSVFQAEFDFGIAQFRMVFAPMMIALAAGVALVAARLFGGPGVALFAAGFFVVLRFLVSFTITEVFVEADNWFPLYVGSAALVELLALTPLVKRRLWFGAAAGLLIATVGTLIEKLWNDHFYPFAWARDMWHEGAVMTIAVGICAGVMGALFAMGLDGDLPRGRVSRTLMIGSCLVLAVTVWNGLNFEVPKNATATITTMPATVKGAEVTHEAITITMTVEPADLIDDHYTWVQLMAWQGGHPGVVSDNLKRTGPNTWESTKPVPVEGNWKTLVRVQDGPMMAAVPVYLPEDRAIGAAELHVEPRFTRQFTREIEILQRERNLGAPTWLWAAGNMVVLICSILMLIGIGVATSRVSTAIAGEAELRRRNEQDAVSEAGDEDADADEKEPV